MGISKYDMAYPEPIVTETFEVGEKIELEDYPPERYDNPKTKDFWPGVEYCQIVKTWDYDGDEDDYGRPCFIEAGAWIVVVPKGISKYGVNVEPFIEKHYISELYKEGELYGNSDQ